MRDKKECLECGSTYLRRGRGFAGWFRSQFCSCACKEARVVARTWISSQLNLAEGGCRLWTGSLDSNGYGSASAGGRLVLAHRESWRRAHGDVPIGKFVLHSCDKRACIEPSHLFLGTQLDNVVDMTAKGRRVDQRPHPPAFRRAASLLAAHGVAVSSIASILGCSRNTISRITKLQPEISL